MVDEDRQSDARVFERACRQERLAGAANWGPVSAHRYLGDLGTGPNLLPGQYSGSAGTSARSVGCRKKLGLSQIEVAQCSPQAEVGGIKSWMRDPQVSTLETPCRTRYAT
jgi:hypothetical protein